MTSPKFVPTVPAGLLNVGLREAFGTDDRRAFAADELLEVLGSPGAGKTSALILRFMQLVRPVAEGGLGLERTQVLVLAATRDSAATLRDVLALDLGGASLGPLARTVSSVAYALVRHSAMARGDKAPELISGAEQDAIFARLIEEHEATAAAELWPPHINVATRGLKGFRTELRDLISACQELGLDSRGLRDLAAGSRTMIGAWSASAHLFEAYEALLATPEFSHKFDSPSLINKAIALLQAGEAGELHNFAAVMIDDAQELTPSAKRFVEAIVNASGAGLAIFSDPDSATLGFRGADPALAGRLVRQIASVRGVQVRQLVLAGATVGESATVVPGRGYALSRLSRQIHAEGAGVQRAGLSAGEGSAAQPMAAHVFQDQQSEVAWLALQLRRLHLIDGVAWEDIAVVGRTREVLDQLERELAAEDVPVRIVGAQSALRDEFAARELLLLAQLACTHAEVGNTITDGPSAEALLLGPYAGFDSVTVRRLRRELRQGELAGGGDRNTDDLLVEIFENLNAATTLRGPEARRLRKFLKLMSLAKEMALDQMKSIEDLLWLIWNAADLGPEWKENARTVGEVAVQANRNLDAVVALFAAANRYVERNPGAPKKDFIAAQLDQAVPEDSLSFRHNARGTVSLLTPAGLVGRRFHTVAVPHLIEGVWPNLKPRSTLLGAATLVASVGGTLTEAGQPQRTELADETRMFFKTIGAATTNVLVSSYSSEEELVSQLLAVVAGSIPATEEFRGEALTLRGLAAARRRALATEKDSAKRASLAADLARLTQAGVAGAHPDDWYGLLQVSSLDPVRDVTKAEGVTIYPSQLENFVKCPLHWFLEAHGAKDADFTAGVGTIIHKALEVASKNDEATLWKQVESRWHTLRFESAWLEQAELRKARTLVSNISMYLDAFRLKNGELLDVERGFDVKVGNAKLVGRVDRLERLENGNVLIVDLKTGTRKYTGEEASNHAQLGLYQIAYVNGAFSELQAVADGAHLEGGKLLLVGTESHKFEERNQASVENNPEAQAKFEAMIAEAVTGMAMTEKHYVARVSSHCEADNEYGTCSIHLTKAVSHFG